MSGRVLLAVFVGIFLVATGGAADLEIGGVTLRLGMAQDKALAALSKEFDPKQVSITEGKYVLWRREQSPLGQAAGSVSFKDGKLYRAAKTWGETPTPMGGRTSDTGLFAVLAEVAGKQGRTGRVTAETLRAPASHGVTGLEVRLLTLGLPPDRKIILQISETIPSPGGPMFQGSVIVEELLVDLPPAK